MRRRSKRVAGLGSGGEELGADWCRPGPVLPLSKMNPLSLTKADPVAAAAFSAELGIGKRLRAQTFMRANTAASREEEKSTRPFGFALETEEPENPELARPREGTTEKATTNPSDPQA
jgi:hypothetical protein